MLDDGLIVDELGHVSTAELLDELAHLASPAPV